MGTGIRSIHTELYNPSPLSRFANLLSSLGLFRKLCDRCGQGASAWGTEVQGNG